MVVITGTFEASTHLLPEQQQDTVPGMGTVMVTATGTVDMQVTAAATNSRISRCLHNQGLKIILGRYTEQGAGMEDARLGRWVHDLPPFPPPCETTTPHGTPPPPPPPSHTPSGVVYRCDLFGVSSLPYGCYLAVRSDL